VTEKAGHEAYEEKQEHEENQENLSDLRANAFDLHEKLLTKLKGFSPLSVRKWFETGNASPSAP